MITVHHESWVATLEISIPETWKKSNFYQLVKNHFWGVCQNDYNFTEGGYSKMITVLHRGGMPKWLQYYIGGGSLGTPKSDYVICARPLNGVAVNSYFDIPCDFFSGVSKDILICVAYPCSHTKRCGNDHFRQNILHLPKMQNITPHKLRGMIHFITFMKVLKGLLWKMFVIINIWIK